MDLLHLVAYKARELCAHLSVKSANIPIGAIAAFVSLAQLSTVATRSALTGGAALLDSLVNCPGSHLQHLAPQLSQAEYPAVAALTTGYVFRVENPATVYFLQQISHTGALTNLIVTRYEASPQPLARTLLSALWSFQSTSPLAALTYLLLPILTTLSLSVLIIINDTYSILILCLLIFARFLNTLLIIRRAAPQWHGQPEPGEKGDLLVLLSQDRWVRIRGLVDDLKTTTSGQWLREPTLAESALQATATLLSYGTAGLMAGMSNGGAAVLVTLLVVSVALLGAANAATEKLCMHGCTVEIDADRSVRRYARRLEMVKEMLNEDDRNDEAMRLGLARMGVTVPGRGKGDEKTRGGDAGAVTM